jgi:hypothetical protein
MYGRRDAGQFADPRSTQEHRASKGIDFGAVCLEQTDSSMGSFEEWAFVFWLSAVPDFSSYLHSPRKACTPVVLAGDGLIRGHAAPRIIHKKKGGAAFISPRASLPCTRH